MQGVHWSNIYLIGTFIHSLIINSGSRISCPINFQFIIMVDTLFKDKLWAKRTTSSSRWKVNELVHSTAWISALIFKFTNFASMFEASWEGIRCYKRDIFIETLVCRVVGIKSKLINRVKLLVVSCQLDRRLSAVRRLNCNWYRNCVMGYGISIICPYLQFDVILSVAVWGSVRESYLVHSIESGS